MSTWPNRGCLRRPLRGGWNNESRTARREVKPSRSDSSQQASSKPGAIQSLPPPPIDFWHRVSEQFAINSGAHVLESRVIRWFHDFELH